MKSTTLAALGPPVELGSTTADKPDGRTLGAQLPAAPSRTCKQPLSARNSLAPAAARVWAEEVLR